MNRAERRQRRREQEEADRFIVLGRPDVYGSDNSVRTSKYMLLTFFPIAIREQFRRNGNVYFLCIGTLMAIGWYSPAFDSAISPWTTFGPLAIVVAISLLQEALADMARHRSDDKTNKHPCVILRRAHDLDESGGERDEHVHHGHDVAVSLRKTERSSGVANNLHGDVTANDGSSTKPLDDSPSLSEADRSKTRIAFENVMRMDMRAGHIILVKNREMIPADLILLASSSEGGSAYIETSSIDGETNLKLRTSPQLPTNVLGSLSQGVSDRSITGEDKPSHLIHETLEQAVKRIARCSFLGYPDGVSALLNPVNANEDEEGRDPSNILRSQLRSGRADSVLGSLGNRFAEQLHHKRESTVLPRVPEVVGPDSFYVATLTSEAPNASVNTYSGKLTFPPTEKGGPSIHIPLNAENILLRGAVLRNTEWAIGVACFTGKDTKLVKNSVKTPSKFSQLDQLINRTVVIILCVMLICILVLAGFSVATNNRNFENFWYLGYIEDTNTRWPYLEEFDLEPPDWFEDTPNYGQMVFLFITLLNNFIPLSLYVTVEMITFALMAYINVDLDMYHEETDTPALARSTIVTDLGQVQYVFSDKTGTLTCNVMRFKRCSVDGMIFGAPVEKNLEANARRLSNIDVDNEPPPQSFHPLRQLLVGAVRVPNLDSRIVSGNLEEVGLEGLGDTTKQEEGLTRRIEGKSRETLTFNAEMFLRVMSLCHTVVVEKEFDPNEIGGDELERSESNVSSTSFGLHKTVKKFWKPKKARKSEKQSVANNSSASENGGSDKTSGRSGNNSKDSPTKSYAKGPDGAPFGYAYQAESPDEGALVTAASQTYGFQLQGRDASGVRLACSSPSLFEDDRIVKGIKNGTLSAKRLAAETALPLVDGGGKDEQNAHAANSETNSNGTPRNVKMPRFETWTVLAVNKFDSERKRMSVIVRSPPELGSIPMLLCKGADSSMLDPKVCDGAQNILTGDEGSGEFSSELPRPPSKLHHTRGLSAGSDNSLSSIPEAIEETYQKGESAVEITLSGSNDESRHDDWEMAAMLGIQAHLGDFASEGLRTLVLGIRILSEHECTTWLAKHKAASTSIKDRGQKLKDCAFEIERQLHIVGATAIEDKLQEGVPETIAALERAGIKLWVLTGDKRETAIEIGYSTKVLTPKMHLTEVAAGPVDRVKTLMAMEFIRLVKIGKLEQYQKKSLNLTETKRPAVYSLFDVRGSMGRVNRRLSRFIRRSYYHQKALFCRCVQDEETIDNALERIDKEEQNEKEGMLDPRVRGRAVRNLAEKIIADYLLSPEGQAECSQRRTLPRDQDYDYKPSTKADGPGRDDIPSSRGGGASSSQAVSPPSPTPVDGTRDDDDDDNYPNGEENLSLTSDALPTVFNRAQSAKAMLHAKRNSGGTSMLDLRNLSIAQMTSEQMRGDLPLVDEDTLSLASFLAGDKSDDFNNFDKSKRTIMERLFAVDREVRHGHLNKHLKKEKKHELFLNQSVDAERCGSFPVDDRGTGTSGRRPSLQQAQAKYGPRALVIEGAALVPLLGDPLLEEMLFSVASSCEAVVACRVSPKQKALLVKLVRNYVSPTPVTLAIGDGANDVGMIQEAHVGVGISGLEGQQAVNASDFAIAQFRYLEDLLLVHGRWNFIRMSKVVLFSFYKNALLAGLMICYQGKTLYSGTPLFDMWIISIFNFVAGVPILFLGFFDRDIEKGYVKRNPELYASSRRNEYLTLRTIMRWVCITFVHIVTIYFLCMLPLSNGGTITSAFQGLMRNNDKDTPGDGESEDLKSFGTVIYTCLIFALAYKVLYESRSLIHGKWPAITCRKESREGFWSRVAYTWVGVSFLSIGLYFFGVYIYQLIGRLGQSTFFPYVGVASHVFNTRSITWMLVLLVPTTACVFDVTGKLYANMYFPTQTQIHVEIQAREAARSKLKFKDGPIPAAERNAGIV